MSVAVTKAVEAGATTVVCASTGNTAASAAAYAARAGLEAVIFVSAGATASSKLVQVRAVGGRIVEVPIPTYYGDEICYVNGMKYTADVVRDVVEYRLALRGFGTAQWVPPPDDYAFKEGDGSSHAVRKKFGLMLLTKLGSLSWFVATPGPKA